MSKVRVADLVFRWTVSAPGGPESERWIGEAGAKEMFQWFFHTKTFCSMVGKDGGTTGDVDDMFAQRSMEELWSLHPRPQHVGPVRGPWPDDFMERLVG